MGIQSGNSLVVPIMLWGRHPPSHTISALALSSDQTVIITGSSEGQLCLWDAKPDQSIIPRSMLYGHSGKIMCIAHASAIAPYIVSASDTGEMCLWDIQDGRCIESKQSAMVHTCMQAYTFSANKSISLICNGQYPEIHIIDASSLEVVYSLVARVHPDWINALCVLKPVKRDDDVIVAISNSGTVKMWSIGISMLKTSQLYEDESKQIRCVDAQTLRCCPYNQRTVLIVCSRYWQIYDAGEFSLLCHEPCEEGNRWTGGDFIALDKVIVWNSTGQALLYKLPNNSNPDHSDYHHFVGHQAMQHASPSLYYILDTNSNKVLPTPSMFICQQNGQGNFFVLRADADCSIHYWPVSAQLPVTASTYEHLPTMYAIYSMSLNKLWQLCEPIGLLDNVEASAGEDGSIKVTCSLYIDQTGRFICGRTDGSIVIIPILSILKHLLLTPSHDTTGAMSLYRILSGHRARINCLLYPHQLDSRYSPNHLVSGSADFTVKLWDLSQGQLVHTFSVHAGELCSFHIPPARCSTRVQSSICCVASDHSVSLLSIKEKKCLLFASRHMFPVQAIKWRPLEDFMIVSCSDSTAYVWEMETGLLDRVVHGVTADEMLKGCDEAVADSQLSVNPTNPQLSISQALKRRNLAALRTLANQTFHQIETLTEDDDLTEDIQANLVAHHVKPLLVQGLRNADEDAEAHLLLFDTEALIVQLLCDEFGISASEYFAALSSSVTQQAPIDGDLKISDIFSMVKEKADSFSQNLGLQIEVEPRPQPPPPQMSTRRKPMLNNDSSSISSSDKDNGKSSGLCIDIAQLLISVLHAWNMDCDLDKLCLRILGLDRVNQSVCCGLMSGSGYMILMLPTVAGPQSKGSRMDYWEISKPLTTQHLLSVISLANTLMSMNNATFIKQSRNRQMSASVANGDAEQANDQTRQAQIKQGWSLLATLHCVLLPDLVSSENYRSPHLHLLANRWQDRCLEMREASQALMLAELKRIGTDGRQQLITEWAPHMPNLVDDSNGSISMVPSNDDADESQDAAQHAIKKPNNEKRRLEATAIVVLGVIGAEFGSEIEPSRRRGPKDLVGRGSIEGFGLTHHSLAWHTSKALAYLLLNPADCKLPLYAPIRRAAIDLLGRGFTVWQPYIDVSAVLLGLLDICTDADSVLPSLQSGLPLSPVADACRTARHSLTLIATARPATFLTCMAKEVARYNAAAQNTQGGSLQLNTSVLVKAKSEILKVIELLIEKLPNDVADLLVETMDVSIHCLDPISIKNKGLRETFPALCRFHMVSYCSTSRRICVGSKNGTLAFYELKQSRAQTIPFQASPTQAMILYLKASSKETISAHKGAVTAVAFSEDGKYLASYSPVDAKVQFWQSAASSLFGMGSQHTKCVKSYNVPFKAPAPANPNVTRAGRLQWSDARTVVLYLPDGSESKYRV